MRIKNNTGSTVILVGTQITAGSYYTFQSGEENKWRSDDSVMLGVANGNYVMNDGVADLSAANGLRLLAGNSVVVLSQPPFAEPTHRTKRDKAALKTVAPNTSETIDFLLTEERYVTGGSVALKNAEIGDWLTAEVRDLDGVIPDLPYPLNPAITYRQALCENWPVVADYILGQWLPEGSSFLQIDTYPLNAKVTAGLYLRITYHAANSGVDRKVGVNYHLTKKL